MARVCISTLGLFCILIDSLKTSGTELRAAYPLKVKSLAQADVSCALAAGSGGGDKFVPENVSFTVVAAASGDVLMRCGSSKGADTICLLRSGEDVTG